MRLATPLVLAAAASLALAAFAACSSNTPSDTSDAGEDAASDAPDFCGQFTKVGDPCPQASPVVCFADCDGGCRCVPGAGGPTWTCTTDTSCHPDAAPVDLDAADFPDTSGDSDAGASDAASE